MSRSDRIFVAGAAGALVLAVAAAVVLLMPAASPTTEVAALGLTSPRPASASPAPSIASTPSVIVVDVAGAVARPGLVELAGGSRIGEAIAAAGGYASDADLAAAATINLARILSDGEQVRVPRIGESAAAGASTPPTSGGDPTGGSAGAGGGGDGGLVDLNSATPEQLEALPGIGAVTVQKIVAARQERPFASLDDAVQRGVIHRGQLEDIRELATAG